MFRNSLNLDKEQLKNLFTGNLANFISLTLVSNLKEEAAIYFNKQDMSPGCLLASIISEDTKKILASYNHEYLRLIPYFYYFLELGKESTAQAIWEQSLQAREKYLDLIREHVKSSIVWDSLLSIENKNEIYAVYGENWQDSISEQLTKSFYDFYFHFEPQQSESPVNPNANNFYPNFFNKSFEELQKDYRNNLRKHIPFVENDPQSVKEFFYSTEEVNKAKFDYVIPGDALSTHPYKFIRDFFRHGGVSCNTYDLERDYKSYTSIFFRDWRRKAFIFEDCLSYENLKNQFLKMINQDSLPDNDKEFMDFCLNAFYQRYGKEKMLYLMQQYTQFLLFPRVSVNLFENGMSDKPFTSATKSTAFRPVFIGDRIELNCVSEWSSLNSTYENQLLPSQWVQGIHPEYISEENEYITFPGKIEWKWYLDMKSGDEGFHFDMHSVRASNLVLAQFVNGTAAYGINDRTANDSSLFPDGEPVNNHAYAFSDIVNCANEQEALRANHNLDNLDLFKQTGEEFAANTRDRLGITEAIGDSSLLGNTFHSYESAGDALMQRILKRDYVAKRMVDILEKRMPIDYLSTNQCDVLRFHTKNALEKRKVEMLENCHYLISGWEKEIVKNLQKLMQENIEQMDANIQIRVPLRILQQLDQAKLANNNIHILQANEDKVHIQCANQIRMNENSALADLVKLYNKLSPTYQIKHTLESAGQDLSDMVNATKQAAIIFGNNIKYYRKERYPGWRDALYGLALLFCVPTGGLTVLAAMGYSYATTGTCFFLSESAKTRSNILKESFQDAGIVFRN